MGRAAQSLARWFLHATPSPSTVLVQKREWVGGICSFCILGLRSCCKTSGSSERVFICLHGLVTLLLLTRNEEAGVHVP